MHLVHRMQGVRKIAVAELTVNNQRQNNGVQRVSHHLKKQVTRIVLHRVQNFRWELVAIGFLQQDVDRENLKLKNVSKM